MQLQTLLIALEEGAISYVPTDIDIEIASLAYDSRSVQAHSLFIAVPGTHTDGRNFLEDAAQRGAVAALGEALPPHITRSLPLPYIEVRDVRVALANLSCAFYGYPAQRLCTIGVTFLGLAK